MRYLRLFLLILVFFQKTLPAENFITGPPTIDKAAGLTIHHRVELFPSGIIAGAVECGIFSSTSGDYFGFNGKSTTTGPKKIQKTLDALLLFNNEIQKRLYGQPKSRANISSRSITGATDCGREIVKTGDCFGPRHYNGDFAFRTTPDPGSATTSPSTINLSPESQGGSGTTSSPTTIRDRN